MTGFKEGMRVRHDTLGEGRITYRDEFVRFPVLQTNGVAHCQFDKPPMVVAWIALSLLSKVEPENEQSPQAEFFELFETDECRILWAPVARGPLAGVVDAYLSKVAADERSGQQHEYRIVPVASPLEHVEDSREDLNETIRREREWRIGLALRLGEVRKLAVELNRIHDCNQLQQVIDKIDNGPEPLREETNDGHALSAICLVDGCDVHAPKEPEGENRCRQKCDR